MSGEIKRKTLIHTSLRSPSSHPGSPCIYASKNQRKYLSSTSWLLFTQKRQAERPGAKKPACGFTWISAELALWTKSLALWKPHRPQRVLRVNNLRFAKNFVLRVLENIDCFEQENVIVARSTINRLVKTERISVHWSRN